MRVEPELEAVDVLLEPRLGALSVLARKVGVDSICRRLRLVADDHADGDGDDGQRSGKAEVDDRYREAARNPEPFQGAHQRVEQQRDQSRDEEEEDRVKDLPERAGSRSARAREGRPAESSAGSESSASRRTWASSYRAGRLSQASRPGTGLHSRTARSPSTLPTSGRRRPRLRGSPSYAVARSGAVLQDADTSVTVPCMPPPRAPGQARRTSKARAAARRRARRIAGLIAVSIALLVTFLLTAFGSGSSAPTQTRPAPANRLLPAGQPRPQVVALHGSLRLQLPIDQSRVTAIGYHAVGDGALALDPVGRQANEGLIRPRRPEALRRRRARPDLLPARWRRGTGHGGARRRGGAGHRRLLAG